MKFLTVVKTRRALLKSHFDIVRQFKQIEESCIPSYAHNNLAAAWISWYRLACAAKAYWQRKPKGPILDFGAASGELFHVIQPNEPYHFVELNDSLANALLYFEPESKRQTLETLSSSCYGVIFALDSLEHNDNIPELLDCLRESLAEDGLLILSGPTENWLYRLGRRLVGFSGHYHTATISDIETMTATSFIKLAKKTIPLPFAPLFSITVWKKK